MTGQKEGPSQGHGLLNMVPDQDLIISGQSDHLLKEIRYALRNGC